jgi:hypothetical protein
VRSASRAQVRSRWGAGIAGALGHGAGQGQRAGVGQRAHHRRSLGGHARGELGRGCCVEREQGVAQALGARRVVLIEARQREPREEAQPVGHGGLVVQRAGLALGGLVRAGQPVAGAGAIHGLGPGGGDGGAQVGLGLGPGLATDGLEGQAPGGCAGLIAGGEAVEHTLIGLLGGGHVALALLHLGQQQQRVVAEAVAGVGGQQGLGAHAQRLGLAADGAHLDLEELGRALALLVAGAGAHGVAQGLERALVLPQLAQRLALHEAGATGGVGGGRRVLGGQQQASLVAGALVGVGVQQALGAHQGTRAQGQDPRRGGGGGRLGQGLRAGGELDEQAVERPADAGLVARATVLGQGLAERAGRGREGLQELRGGAGIIEGARAQPRGLHHQRGLADAGGQLGSARAVAASQVGLGGQQRVVGRQLGRGVRRGRRRGERGEGLVGALGGQGARGGEDRLGHGRGGDRRARAG